MWFHRSWLSLQEIVDLNQNYILILHKPPFPAWFHRNKIHNSNFTSLLTNWKFFIILFFTWNLSTMQDINSILIYCIHMRHIWNIVVNFILYNNIISIVEGKKNWISHLRYTHDIVGEVNCWTIKEFLEKFNALEWGKSP